MKIDKDHHFIAIAVLRAFVTFAKLPEANNDRLVQWFDNTVSCEDPDDGQMIKVLAFFLEHPHAYNACVSRVQLPENSPDKVVERAETWIQDTCHELAGKCIELCYEVPELFPALLEA